MSHAFLRDDMSMLVLVISAKTSYKDRSSSRKITRPIDQQVVEYIWGAKQRSLKGLAKKFPTKLARRQRQGPFGESPKTFGENKQARQKL